MRQHTSAYVGIRHQQLWHLIALTEHMNCHNLEKKTIASGSTNQTPRLTECKKKRKNEGANGGVGEAQESAREC
jgi:hypothetical protein